MTTQPAPLLLTAECAAFAAKLDDIPSFLQIRLQALADGRTACVRVMSEDECRAEFEAWYFLHAWKLPTPAEIWLACARANGLVKP